MQGQHPIVVPQYSQNLMKPNENMKLNTMSMMMRIQTRTSKTILNENAQKFKLQKLETNIIRYECIYKNLLRDVRKIFTILFNSHTQYQTIKKKSSSASYFNFVKDFIVKIFGTSALQFFNIDIDEAAFHLGSFIYPKYMIKCLNEEFGNDTALTAQEKADN